ncbi:MAG TPA: hypothetical protein VEX42_00235 [Microbacterium sp.]|nr:hypothetical protein [Microbacterium sp.]
MRDLLDDLLDGVENDTYEVIADEISAQVKAALAAPIEVLYPELRGA